MKKLRTIDLCLIPLVFAGITTAILRMHALLTSFNRITLHFDDKTVIGFANGLLIVTIIGFLTYLFLSNEETSLIARNNNAASYIPAGIVCTALLFMGVRNIEMGIDGYPEGILRTLSLVSAILAFLSVGSFFISIFVEKNESLVKAAFSLSIVFFLAVYATFLFFNRQTHPTNSPNKVIDQMAYISSAIFFLFESRIPLGRAKWRPYVAFGLIATLLTAYSAIPSIIVYLLTGGYLVSESIFENALSLALSLFIFSKVIQTQSLTQDVECPEAGSIILMSKIREEEIENQRKLSRANNNKVESDDTQDASNYTFDLPYVDSTGEINQNDADIDISQSE